MSTQIELSDCMTAPGAPPAGDALGSRLFSATVQGMDANGEWFERNVPLDGHLDGHLYLKLDLSVELDAALFIVMRLAGELNVEVSAVRIAVHGKVDRVVPVFGGSYDLRVVALDHKAL